MLTLIRERFFTRRLQPEVCFIHLPKNAGITIKRTIRTNNTLKPVGKGANLLRFRCDSAAVRFTIIGHNIRLADHMTLERYKREVSPDCFSVGFVRNPFDRVVSAFTYLNDPERKGGDRKDGRRYVHPYNGDFNLFVRKAFSSDHPEILSQMHFRPQWEWVCDASRTLLLDYVGRFERLNEDLRALAKRFGFEVGDIPHLNKSERRPYREYYDSDSVEIIRRHYLRDLELFSYEF